MKMSKWIFLFFVLIPLIVHSQNNSISIDRDVEVVKSTINSILKKDESNPIYIKRNGNVFKKVKNLLIEFDSASRTFDFNKNGEYSMPKDSLKILLDTLKFLEDTINTINNYIVETKKFYYAVDACMYGFEYLPWEYNDLRKAKDWEATIKDVKEEITSEDSFRLDTIVKDLSYLGIIKSFIQKKTKSKFVSNIYWKYTDYFVTSNYQNLDTVKYYKISHYQFSKVVYNQTKTKACYILKRIYPSLDCYSIFVLCEKNKNKWDYVGSIPFVVFSIDNQIGW